MVNNALCDSIYDVLLILAINLVIFIFVDENRPSRDDVSLHNVVRSRSGRSPQSGGVPPSRDQSHS